MKRILAHAEARRRAHADIDQAPDGWVADCREPVKSRIQEEKYHAMIGEIAEQHKLFGRLWDAEDMKRILVDQFRRDTIKDPDIAPLWAAMGHVEMCPSIDGMGVVALGVQTRKFGKKLGSVFIEWLYAFGAENGIKTNENMH